MASSGELKCKVLDVTIVAMRFAARERRVRYVVVCANQTRDRTKRENAILRLMARWDSARMDVLMLLVPLATAYNSQGIGDFNMDADGRLSRRVGDAPAPYVWTGIQLLSKKLIVDPPSDVFSTNVFWDRAIAEGRCIGLVHEGMWFDVGYPAAIAATEERLGLHGVG
jgi:MurNAc alpha-1-phosphate uridylyltransferase